MLRLTEGRKKKKDRSVAKGERHARNASRRSFALSPSFSFTLWFGSAFGISNESCVLSQERCSSDLSRCCKRNGNPCLSSHSLRAISSSDSLSSPSSLFLVLLLSLPRSPSLRSIPSSDAHSTCENEILGPAAKYNYFSSSQDFSFLLYCFFSLTLEQVTRSRTTITSPPLISFLRNSLFLIPFIHCITFSSHLSRKGFPAHHQKRSRQEAKKEMYITA